MFYLFPNANDITRKWLKSQFYLPSFSSGTLTKRYCIIGGGGGTGGQADMGSTGASESPSILDPEPSEYSVASIESGDITDTRPVLPLIYQLMCTRGTIDDVQLHEERDR